MARPRRAGILFVTITLTVALLSGYPIRQAAAAPSAKVTTTDAPALTSTGADSLALFWRDTRSHRLSHEDFRNAGWTQPGSLGGGLRTGPAAATDTATGQTLVAAVGDDGELIVRAFTGGKWRGWSSMDRRTSWAPAVANLGGGSFAVVVHGTDDRAYLRTLRNGRWSSWTKLAGRPVLGAPAAAGRPDGSLVVAVAGTDRAIRTATVSVSGKQSAWSAPVGVVGAQSRGLSLAIEPDTGTWHLAVRNDDETASVRAYQPATDNWGEWRNLGGKLASGPAIAASGRGHLDLVAFGADGKLIQDSAVQDQWTGFDPVAPLTVPKTTKVLPAGAVASVAGEPGASQTVTLAKQTPVPAVGDVLVSDVSTATPYGLLVKVVSVTVATDGTKTVNTQPAQLSDAVTNASINAPVTLSAADVLPTGGAAAPRSTQPHAAAAASPVIQAISKSFACSGSVASISGSVSISADLLLYARWGLTGGLQFAQFTGAIGEDAHLGVSIGGQATCALSPMPLLAKPIMFRPITFTVGIVPVVIVPQLQLYLDASGTVRAAVTTDAHQSLSATAGLVYSSGSTRPVARLANTFDYTPPTWSERASVQADVSPKFSFLLYGVTGPTLDTRVYIRFDADSAARPAWTLRAGFTAGAQLSLPVYHNFAVGISAIIQFEKIIAQGTTGPGPGPGPAPTDWPQKQYGPDRSGVNPADTTINASNAAGLQQAWAYSAPDVVAPRTPVAAGGSVFEPVQTTGLGGRLVALSLATGAVLWQQTLDGMPGSSAAVAGHTVVVQTSHTLYGFDTATGAPQWTTSLALPSCQPPAPAVVADTVYVATGSGVAAVSATTGSTQWQTTFPGVCAGSPAISGGKLFVVSRPYPNGQVNALDAATGAIVWSHEFTDPLDGDVSVGHGMVYVTTQYAQTAMTALDQSSGAVRWQQPVTGFMKTPTITANAILVGGGEASGIQSSSIAVNPTTGATIWNQQYPNILSTGDIAVANGLGFVGTDGGTLGIFRVDTGTLVAQIKVGPGATNYYSPIISSGTVLVPFPGIVGNSPPVPARFVAYRLP
ncbi:PQQ-binding-like beta-propeller repeat protein [Planosporangium thailandense]|uniref:PQQ-binding-like beta-propeller repeat protein n=2 Tax=Planosporangium thailandense TaxID=765197 RepID=A0ABX0Y6K7_9ACTN|nr:PQQ-binding-like beta-propeller repeat protein [Planosporangium thailandense]